MTKPADGQVHKVIRVVATSSESWEDAARGGVQEAARSITDLRSAKVTEMDTVVDNGGIGQYRVKLEMVFQLDRSRRATSGETVHVRRYLIIANETLVSQALHDLIDDRAAAGPAEFHVLAPKAPRSTMSQLIDRAQDAIHLHRDEHDTTAADAEERLRLFRYAFSRLGDSLTGEVGGQDPIAAVRRVLERSSFDEIIVSMLPPKRSRWTKDDLLRDLERAVPVPVTTLAHDEGDDLASCPIG